MKLKLYFFELIVCTICICSTGLSQTRIIDSLKQNLPSPEGRPRADIFLSISREYMNLNHDSTARFANESLLLSKRLGYTWGVAESNRMLGWSANNPQNAVEYFSKALSIFRSISNKKGIADTYNNLGTFWGTRNDSISLDCYDSALTNYRLTGNKKGESAVLNYIGIVYQEMGNYQKAIDFTLKGLDIRKSTNDYKGVVWSYINAGQIYLAGGQYETALKLFLESISYAQQHGLQPYESSYTDLGKTYLWLKQYDKARTYLFRPATSGYDPSNNHLLLGQFYHRTNQQDSALIEFKKSLSDAQHNNDQENIAESYIGLSETFLKQNKMGLSIEYAKQAYAVADSLKDKHYLADAALIMSPYYEATGDFKKSLQLFKLAHTILDSISTESNENYQHKLAEFDSKSQIETEKNRVNLLSAEKALQEQKLDAEKLYKQVVLIGCGIILLISFITIRNISRKRDKIQSQKDVIDQQKEKVEMAYSELQATQAQLIQREKMASLGELTAGIAHEIQNPLNFVNNFSDINTELIDEMNEKMKSGDLDEAAKVAEVIRDNNLKINHHGRRADSIVKGMLQHSRSSSGQKESTDINALADEYLRLSYHGLRAKDKSFNAAMITDFDKNAEKINLVTQDIGRVLLNLYNNSFYSVNEKMKTKPAGYEPTVWVSTKQKGDWFEIRIKDNGTGIPKKIQDKIFQPFFTTKPTGEGTGLGLSLSYDIITKGHGGELKMDSTEGEYVEFTILLPVGK
jgi:two-component system, NtrC family, sensor kinase